MSPIVHREEAKEAGWGQVRQALVKFEGTVVGAEFGQWGGKLFDDNGKPRPPKEFLEVKNVDVKVLEVSEELAMDIEGQDFEFRVNTSDFKGSFWVEKFLASADEYKLLIPDDLVGKRITWVKALQESRDPKFNVTNYIIAGVRAVEDGDKAVVGSGTTATPAKVETVDPMVIATELAIGKTETQFRSAISLHPAFVGSPILTMAKAGMVTAALVKDGKLVEVTADGKTTYAKP